MVRCLSDIRNSDHTKLRARPMVPTTNQPLYSCMTKALIADGNQLRTGPKWVTSRRASLKLYSDRLECGDWIIPYDDIREAVLSSFRSPMLRIPGYVLAVRTDGDTYHFGLNGGRYWEGELPFPLKRQQASLKMSPLSLIARVGLIGYAVYLVWNWLS
jgi:hypothetical protein